MNATRPRARVGLFTAGVIWVCFLLSHSACAPDRGGVVFWDLREERSKASDWAIDPQRQIEALQRAVPEEDAARAFTSGDLRLVAIRLGRTLVLGVPEDPLTLSLIDNQGCKAIAVTEELLSNAEFVALKERYESNYNARLHELVAKAAVGNTTGRRK